VRDRERDRLAAEVVKLRDEDGLPWEEAGERVGKTGAHLRGLYNRGERT
jgi:hypothetical protein